MASRPEFPLLAAGGLALASGYAREGKFPKNGTKAVLATATLVVLASAAGDTPVGPLITALAWLALLGVAYAAIPALTTTRKVKNNG